MADGVRSYDASQAVQQTFEARKTALTSEINNLRKEIETLEQKTQKVSGIIATICCSGPKPAAIEASKELFAGKKTELAQREQELKKLTDETVSKTHQMTERADELATLGQTGLVRQRVASTVKSLGESDKGGPIPSEGGIGKLSEMMKGVEGVHPDLNTAVTLLKGKLEEYNNADSGRQVTMRKAFSGDIARLQQRINETYPDNNIPQSLREIAGFKLK